MGTRDGIEPPTSNFQPHEEPWEVRMERKLDEVIEWQRKADLRFNDGQHQFKDHSVRIGRMEKAGVAVVVFFLVGAFGVIGSAAVWAIQAMKGTPP